MAKTISAVFLASFFVGVGCMGGNTPGYPGDLNADAMTEPDAMGPPVGLNDAASEPITCTGSDCACESGFHCIFECPDGECVISCAAGSWCDVSCPGGKCDIECAATAYCTSECASECVLTCAEGATCEQECASGPHSGCECDGC